MVTRISLQMYEEKELTLIW